MAENIEIKAILRNREEVEERASGLADGPALILRQRDTFFDVPFGRLKLRVEDRGSMKLISGQIIYYERSDERDAKSSFYEIVETESPEEFEHILRMALGVRGCVTKERTLYLTGPTRIHLDRVEGLGDFMELEVVLDDSTSRSKGKEIAEDLMQRLGIPDSDRVKGAYMDLMEAVHCDKSAATQTRFLEGGS
jgi:predicted adenylyl cyclase CyaB